jgi:hypothetical protein
MKNVNESTIPTEEPSLSSTLQHTFNNKFPNTSTKNVIHFL